MSIIGSRYLTTTNSEKEIEAQKDSNPTTWPRRTSSVPSHTTICTNIWSAPSSSASASVQEPAVAISHTPLHARTRTKSEIDVEDEGSIDPHFPKMGTRAYRERERREFAASTASATSTPSSSASSTPKKKDKQMRVYADNVHQELGMHVLAPAHLAKEDKNEGIAGVIVTRSLEVKEERANDSGRAGF
tara:strand:+ start:80 stop:646 length:567 start_codon:yes stop_codon:yes gene_type:complete